MIATHEDIAMNLLGVNELIYLVASCCTTKGTEREREYCCNITKYN